MFRNEEINHKQMELPIKKEKERKKEGVQDEHEVNCIKLVALSPCPNRHLSHLDHTRASGLAGNDFSCR